jgi:hypothetical protein
MEPSMTVTKLSQEQIEKAWALRQSGWTYQRIADLHGTWATNIKRILDKRYVHDKPLGAWKSNWTNPSDPHIIGYMAGIVDGEGSFVKANGKHWYFKLNMTDHEVLDLFASYGGTRVRARPPRTERHKPSYEWNLSRTVDVAEFCKAIYPYLKVPEKRRRVEEILAKLYAA